MRIGILGGTFDPPHLGHMILAVEAVDQLKLARLLWVLTPNPPHKTGQTITPLRYRLAMLQSAIAGEAGFEISRVDIDRPPPHYALDTVKLLARQYPGADLVYLMGGDSLSDLPTWRWPQEFVAACDALGVMRRQQAVIDLEALEASVPGVREKVSFVRAPLLEIASSDIRRRVAAGRPYRYYLSPQVYAYIQREGLYREAP